MSPPPGAGGGDSYLECLSKHQKTLPLVADPELVAGTGEGFGRELSRTVRVGVIPLPLIPSRQGRGKLFEEGN